MLDISNPAAASRSLAFVTAVEKGIAKTIGVPSSWLSVSIEVKRRLEDLPGASDLGIRRLQVGSVEALYSISIPVDSGDLKADPTAVYDKIANASFSRLADNINSEVVASVPSASFAGGLSVVGMGAPTVQLLWEESTTLSSNEPLPTDDESISVFIILAVAAASLCTLGVCVHVYRSRCRSAQVSPWIDPDGNKSPSNASKVLPTPPNDDVNKSPPHKVIQKKATTQFTTTDDGILNTDQKQLETQEFKDILGLDLATTKNLEACLREDVMQIEDFSTTTGRFLELFLAEVKEVTNRVISERNVLETHVQLTRDTIAALVAFTIEIESVGDLIASNQDQFYHVYGNVIRACERQKLQLLAGYSHYLFQGLKALPAYSGLLWRGIRGRKAVVLVLKKYNKKFMDIVWTSFTSASPSRQTAKFFARTVEEEDGADPEPRLFPGVTSLMFRLEVSSCARDIRACSAFPREDERTLLPNTLFIVEKLAHHSTEDNMLEIHLAEKPEASFTF